MTCKHEYDKLMRDIPIHNGTNMKLADWLLQTEKVALPTDSQVYELVTAKSTSTPYKMLKRIGRQNWQEIEKNWRKCAHQLLWKYMQPVTYIENNDQMKLYKKT